MKKIVKYLFLFVGFFVIGTIGVNAKTVNTDGIATSTYVIGKHMFTRNTNENYNGQLTTQLIMMASKTIDGNTMSDMIIYYKNARGNWVDALTGNSVNISKTIEINYIDTKEALETPILEAYIGYGGDENGTAFHSILSISDLGTADGMEIYYSTSEDGEYKLLDTVEDTTYDHMVKDGYHYYYKVRLYRNNGKSKDYSDYSNIVDCDYSFDKPDVVFGCGGTADGDFGYALVVKAEPDTVDGFEIYYSEELNGPYELLDIVSDLFTGYPLSDEGYYKVRVYKDYDGERVYSDFSDIVNYPLDIEEEVSFAYYFEDHGIDEQGNRIMNIVLEDWGEASGMEVYYSNAEDGEYEFLTSSEDISVEVIIPRNQYYFYKVRIYTVAEDGDKEYSDFASPIFMENIEMNLVVENVNALENGDKEYTLKFETAVSLPENAECTLNKVMQWEDEYGSGAEYSPIANMTNSKTTTVIVPNGEEHQYAVDILIGYHSVSSPIITLSNLAD